MVGWCLFSMQSKTWLGKSRDKKWHPHEGNFYISWSLSPEQYRGSISKVHVRCACYVLMQNTPFVHLHSRLNSNLWESHYESLTTVSIIWCYSTKKKKKACIWAPLIVVVCPEYCVWLGAREAHLQFRVSQCCSPVLGKTLWRIWEGTKMMFIKGSWDSYML